MLVQNFFNKFDLHKSGANKMTKIRRPELNRDSYLKSLDKFANKRTLLPRAPTPPQIGGDVVDDADNMDYRFEQVRLNSFQNWPIPYISPADLAAAGFYYTKHLDRVKCFECSTEICKWEEGDNPNTEHQRWGARCRFIRKLSCGNVPIGVDPRTVPLPRARSFDVCGPYGLEYRLDAEADTHTASSTSGPETSNKARHSMENTQLPSAAMLGCFGIGITRRPDFPEYASYEARLQSFEQWPTAIVQTKEQLADAGFFYTNVGDQTTCYHCGGGLKNWEPQDDPWVQHAKWFSKCFYVLLVKGQEFINSVTGKNVPPLSEEDTKKMNLPSCIKKVEVVVPQKEKNENNQVVNSEEICNTNATETLVKEVNKESIAPSCSTLKESQGKPLDDARVCKICYNDELGVVFLPCGHIVACVKCALGMTTCAVCRKSVTMTARAFFS